MSEGDDNRVERFVQFYRVTSVRNSDGSPTNFDAAASMKHLRTLPYADGPNGLYEDSGNGTVTACYGMRTDRCTFATIRRKSLPQIENNGEVKELAIAANDGIFDPIHVRFFDEGVVGADFNFYGPRISRLANYIRIRVPKDVRGTDFEIEPLFRREPLAQFRKLGVLKMVDLKVTRSYLEEVDLGEADNEVFSALDAAAAFGQADSISIMLHAGRSKNASLSTSIASMIAQLLGRKSFIEQAERLKVSGLDDAQKSATFDLLSDRIYSKKQMLLLDPRTRVVSSASAFEEIQSAYEELKDELKIAASFTPT